VKNMETRNENLEVKIQKIILNQNEMNNKLNDSMQLMLIRGGRTDSHDED